MDKASQLHRHSLVSISISRHVMLYSLVGVTLWACGSHQAPVSDQGQRLVRSAPMVLSSTGRSDSGIIEASEPARVLSVDTRPAVTASSDSTASGAVVTRAAPQQSGGLVRRPVGDEVRGSARPISRPISNSGSSASSGIRDSANSVDLTSAVGNMTSRPLSHLVSAGDTLFSIAFQHDLDFRSLAMANGLTPPYTIFVGQELKLAVGQAVVESAANVVGNGIRSTISAGESSVEVRRPAPAPMPSQPDWRWPHSGRLVNSFQTDVTKGIDISGNVGDPVLAAATGDVVYSGRGVQGTGNLIIIRHTDQYLSAYAHNSAMLVPEGRRVMAGEKIAEVGVDPSGVPMLHFEIRRDGEPIDPTRFLPARQ